MARRKTLPESLRAKLELAERLATLRLELFGERGGPEMARRLGIPVRTWYNYEGGVTVPAEVVLKIIELTSVEPVWLLHGKGPKFRQSSRADRRDSTPNQPSMTVGALLRTALELLENESGPPPRRHEGPALELPRINIELPSASKPRDAQPVDAAALDASKPDSRTRSAGVRQEWLEAQRDNRCIRVSGDSMSPIVADGATVAYSGSEEAPDQLDGKMVVVWLENRPTVRWFQLCGRYALLRAENPETVPQQILVDLEDPAERPRFRRVLWIDTPH